MSPIRERICRALRISREKSILRKNNLIPPIVSILQPEQIMVNALYKTLETHSDIKDKVYLKVSSLPSNDRMDNVVIYLSDLLTEKERKDLVDSFRSECGEGVLEKRENMLQACKYESDGIAYSAEIPLNMIYNAMGPVIDTSKYAENLKKARTNHAGKNPSYTQHIGQLLFAAINMARKNHPEVGSGEKDKIENNPEAMKDVKKYFNELLRLSNVDPTTMKRAV